jgi:hypothetical protein
MQIYTETFYLFFPQVYTVHLQYSTHITIVIDSQIIIDSYAHLVEIMSRFARNYIQGIMIIIRFNELVNCVLSFSFRYIKILHMRTFGQV